MRLTALVAAIAFGGNVGLSAGATAAFGERLQQTQPRTLAQATQVVSGQQVYREICSTCHGDNGEGIDDAPTIIGDGNALADYRTAARLYSFISSEMPDDDPGSLTSQQYYDVLAYLLSMNAMNPTGLDVSPATAGTINLTQ